MIFVVTIMNKEQSEILRSSFDCNGGKVELLFDKNKNRFTVASRWQNLVHFEFLGASSKRLAHERASATFEVVCFDGATKQVAKVAKKSAMRIFPSHCISNAGFEIEVFRQYVKICGGAKC